MFASTRKTGKSPFGDHTEVEISRATRFALRRLCCEANRARIENADGDDWIRADRFDGVAIALRIAADDDLNDIIVDAIEGADRRQVRCSARRLGRVIDVTLTQLLGNDVG